ncbi:hypothetical protein A11Q_39 [Pseudobdellovibrio exovorus JSS]|uniref:Asparagine synthetase domain-containing protein n=2 Tax=Pseudobdellovibrio exovorus TaxID=453816 RepID=M4VMF0_9BACT|nr:hypothetical protein A11Q_39 [Pseudobdellovibrio exovorus JSS]
MVSFQAKTAKESLLSESRILNGEKIHSIEVAKVFADLSSPIEHAMTKAKEIARTAWANNLEIKLFLSGGIDSEAMARAFLAAGIPFVAVIGRYNQNMNEHDYVTAISFCDQFHIPMQFLDVDVYQFLEDEGHLAYGHELGCRSPQLAVYMYMLDQIEGFPVLAGNPIFPILKNSGSELRKELSTGSFEMERVVGLSDQTQAVLFRYFEKRQRLGVPFFFQSCAELMMSFLNLESTIEAMTSGRKNYSYEMKCRAYRDGGFDVEPRADKYTGFEKYREEYDKRLNTQYGKGFDQKFRQPLEMLNPLLAEKIYLPLPAQVTEKLFRKLSSLFKSDANMSRRGILAGVAAAAFGLLIPLPANALMWCCCSDGNCFSTTPKMCKQMCL